MSMADTLAIVMSLAANGGTTGYNPMDLPAPGPVVTIQNQSGGNVSLHASRVVDYDREQTQVRVVGACVSACTLVLALPPDRICVGPGAAFGFHQPFFGNARGIPTTDLGQAIKDVYPRFVKQWLDKNFGGLPAGRPQYMRYDLLKAHYRTCA